MTETSLRTSPDNGVAAVKNRAMPGDADHNVAVYMATQTEAREEEQAGGRLAEGASNTLNDLSNVEVVTISLPAPPEVSAAEAPLEAMAAAKIVTGMVPVARLRPYFKNAEIYREREDALFEESISQNGVLTALAVTEDGEIIGGERRWRVANSLGLPEVPVVVVVCQTDDDKLRRLLDDNVYRVKTAEETVREYMARKAIEARAGVCRKAQAGKKHGKKSEEVKTVAPLATKAGKARNLAAEGFGRTGVSLEKGAKVIEAADKQREKGDAETADDLIHKLDKDGYEPALALAKSLNLIPGSKPKVKTGGASTSGKTEEKPAGRAVKATAARLPHVSGDHTESATTIPAATPRAHGQTEKLGAAGTEDQSPVVGIIADANRLIEHLEELELADLTIHQKGNLYRALELVADWLANHDEMLQGCSAND